MFTYVFQKRLVNVRTYLLVMVHYNLKVGNFLSILVI